MYRTFMFSTALGFGLLLSSLTMAQTADATENIMDVATIVAKTNRAAFYAGQDGRAEARMKIVDGQGRTQLRQFTLIRTNIEDGGDQNFLVLFSRPADVRNTVFMVHKHIDRDDDRWLYLPGLDLVKRIAGGDKRTSFVGAHFFYEDVSGRGIDEDEHQLVDTTPQYYVLRNVPRNPSSVEFSEYKMWVDRSNFLPMKIEYLHRNGKPYRRIEALEVQTIQGHATATKTRVDDLESGGYTLMEMRYIAYGLGIPADVYAERALRNPPEQWLKRPGK